jgi:hypothetical protein
MGLRNFTYLFYGFSAAWLVLAAYVGILAVRERKIKRDLKVLQRMIEDRERE